MSGAATGIRREERGEHSRRGEHGFSVIGVLVVLAIVSVVAAMALPVKSAATPRQKQDDTRNEMGALVPAIQDYFWDCRCFPATFAQLQSNTGSVAGWKGPYALPLLSANGGVNLSLDQDAWNQAYVVTVTATGAPWTPASSTSSITITSSGPDLTAGTADDLKRIVDVTFMRRKETTDELRILNNSIAKYNAVYLATAPLPADLDSIFTALYNASLLPRPPVGATEPLKTDGWGSDYVPSPNVAPVTALASANQ